MKLDTIYGKTEKGKERFEARDIPVALRHALILVDGRSTIRELLKKGQGLENLEDSMEMLEEMGLMAPMEEINAAAAATIHRKSAMKTSSGGVPTKRLLIELAQIILGDKSEKVIRKIEETLDSKTALLHTIDSCGKVIKLTIDENLAKEFVDAAKDIMAKKG